MSCSSPASASENQILRLAAAKPDGQVTLAPFVFEQPAETQDLIESAPVIEESRPNTDGAARADETLPGTGTSIVQK